MLEEEYNPGDYESLSVTSGAVVSLTAAKLNPSTGPYKGRSCAKAFLTLETASIRFRLDGTDPTTLEGHLLTSNDTLELSNKSMVKNFKCIAESTTATLRVTYYY